MQKASEDIKNLNELPDVVYVKKWQQNGFFPIEKYTREKDGKWSLYVRKRNLESGETYFRKSLATYNEDQFIFFFHHNHCLVSDKEMSDSDNFNFN